MNMEDSHEFSLHNMPMDKQNWKKKSLSNLFRKRILEAAFDGDPQLNLQQTIHAHLLWDNVVSHTYLFILPLPPHPVLSSYANWPDCNSQQCTHD